MHDGHKYNPKGRFTNRASHYAQARPAYPLEALDFIYEHCGLSSKSIVCDIGAGTGISTRAIASTGVEVVGVEPNEAMLAEAKSNSDYVDRISYVLASAEETSLPDGKFDLITCAQAFHWFEPRKALAEFSRILKHKGWVALIWNERDESCPFTKAYGDLLRSWPDTSRIEGNRGRAGLSLLESTNFTSGSCSSFGNSQEMSLEKLIGRALSASYAPAPESREAALFSEKLRELFEEYESDGQVVLRYQCSVYSAKKA